MKNITKIFQKAIDSNLEWMFSIFYNVIDTLKDKGIEVSFWESEENWASILIGNNTKGYVWKKYPLIVIEKDTIPNIKMLLNDIHNIYYIEVNSLSKDLCRIEDESIQNHIENFVNFDSFTMEDLWFNTNSI